MWHNLEPLEPRTLCSTTLEVVTLKNNLACVVWQSPCVIELFYRANDGPWVDLGPQWNYNRIVMRFQPHTSYEFAVVPVNALGGPVVTAPVWRGK